MIVLDKDKLEQLGVRMWGRFLSYGNERLQLEKQWLRNLRQYKSIYDPEVIIPQGKSRVYPKDTHTKIVGWTAKMMEMMFPAQEKNWELTITPFPNIDEQDLQNIIATLEQQQQMIAQQPPAQGQPQAQYVPPTSDMIEKAVKEFATQRSVRMEMECEDQLDDASTDYPELCKRVIRRGGIYGFGVAEGPQVEFKDERVFEPDETGKFVAVSRSTARPYFTVLKAWDVYPDLSAQSWSAQEGLFTRRALSRHAVLELAGREDFFGSVIIEYLKEHTRGNYKARDFEAELNVIKTTDQTTATTDVRLFEVVRWYGFISANDLRDIGVTVPATAEGKDILSDIWMLGEAIIKADTAPFGDKVSDMFHAFIPEEDEDGPLTGTAKVEVLRDSQLKICAIDRAIIDNMADSASSIKEVNDDLVDSSKRVGNISGGMTIHRIGEGNEANYPAVRIYDIPNHTQQLLTLRDNFVRVFDSESHLQSWTMGDTQPLGEAFRTSNNMSMMKSGGDMVTKDDVRSFDRFVKSLIGSLVRWNMELNPKTDIKGDYQVMPKGNMSLVAKEVRGAALDQLVSTLTPRDLVRVDTDRLLKDRFTSRDLPSDYILPKAEGDAAVAQYDQQQAAAAQVQQGVDTSKTQMQLATAQEKAAKAQEITQTLNTKVQEGLSRIVQNLAKAKGTKDATALQQVKLLLDQITAEGAGAGVAAKPTGKATAQ
jgi:hypothetical protein